MSLLTDFLAPGIMLPYGGSTAPYGWLLCYGQAVSRTTYAGLFEAIGTTWGSGDGSTTFNVPDMRGRGPVGKDNMGGTAANRVTSGGSGINGTTLGAVGGAETHTLDTTQIPAHNHAINNASGASGSGSSDQRASGASVGEAVTSSNTGGGGAHNNMQPSAVVNWLIKV